MGSEMCIRDRYIRRELRRLFPLVKRLVLHATPAKPAQVLYFFRECKSSPEIAQVDYVTHGHVRVRTSSGVSIAMKHAEFIRLEAQCSARLLLPHELQMPFARWFTHGGFAVRSPWDVAKVVLYLRRRLIAGYATVREVARLWECSERLRERWAVAGDCSPLEFLFWAIVAVGAFETKQAKLEQGMA